MKMKTNGDTVFLMSNEGSAGDSFIMRREDSTVLLCYSRSNAQILTRAI
jgi:hypothetical protein